jgi:hypothetical protein
MKTHQGGFLEIVCSTHLISELDISPHFGRHNGTISNVRSDFHLFSPQNVEQFHWLLNTDIGDEVKLKNGVTDEKSNK